MFVDTAMSSEFNIRDNIYIYTDSGFNNSIPGAVSAVTLMGNSIEIDLDTAVLSTFTAPAGSDLYVRFDGMPGDLLAMDGSELSYFESNFWYQEDSAGGDASGYMPPAGDPGYMPPAAPPAGGSLSFETATYEAGLNRLRIQLFGAVDTAMSNEFSIRENISIYAD